MSTSPKPSSRLSRLDHMLSQSPPPVAPRGGETDPDVVHLASVPLERIRALTTELQERLSAPRDDVDALTMRLLLNDYTSAVAHLRAVSNAVGGRLHAASEHLHHMRKALRREEEMTAKRARVDERHD